MHDLLAESVGSVFSCFFLSWPLLVLWLGSLSERSRWLIIWTLETFGIGLRFTPLHDLRLYLAGLLYACAIYLIWLLHRVIHMGLHSPLIFLFQIYKQIKCCWVHLWNKVGQSGVVGASLIFADVTDRASSPLPTFPLAMSTKQPAHRRKGGSVEVVDSKYAVDLATQQSYSENVFLFVPNLIG